MEFSVKSGSPEKQRSACIVVGVFEPRRLSPIAEQLDKISDGYISALLRRGELEGKPGQTLLLHHVPNVLSERILLIGCGKERELDERQYKQVIQKTINTLNDTGSMEAVCFLTELHVKGRNNYWKVRQAVETAKETLYSFDQLKTNKSEPRRPLRKMVFNVPTRRELTSGERVLIACEDEKQAYRLDEALWARPAESFVPHNLAGEGPRGGAPVEIAWPQKRSSSPRDILISLRTSFADFATAFTEVVDFVPYEDSLKQLARERYKAYRVAGFNLNTATWK